MKYVRIRFSVKMVMYSSLHYTSGINVSKVLDTLYKEIHTL